MDNNVTGNTTFAFGLFSRVLSERPGENVFVSPYSVELALAMTVNGARGATKAGILETFGLPPDASLNQLNRRNQGLITSLTNPDPKVELAIANALWARQGVQFQRGFLNKNKKFYGAEVTALDFADQVASLARINGWVSENTRGKIDRILDSLSPQAALYLMNAIYFKGAWALEFDKNATRERSFTLADGSAVKHRLMFQSGEYDYLRGERFQGVSLPYGDGRASMYILLPDPGVSPARFAAGITAGNWDGWMARFVRSEGDIALPRFKVEFETSLNRALSAMGMSAAFDSGRADFGAICSSPRLHIAEVKHKTFVEVNEEGTEAAAVTSVGFECLSVSARQRFSMVVDRPFVCAIRDNETGTLLFLGSIVDPR